MPTIPRSQETERYDTPQVGQYHIPGAVPGAFGEREAAATEALGKSVSGLSDTANNMMAIQYKVQQQQLKVKQADSTNRYINDLQNILYNPEEEQYKYGDKTLTRPKGFMLQSGYQTVDLTDRLRPVEKALREKYVKEIPDKQAQAELNQSLFEHFLGVQESTIKHEVTERRKADKETYSANRKTLTDSSAMAEDGATLMKYFDKLAKNNQDEEDRFALGKDVRLQQNSKDFAAAADNAATGKLIKTGKIEEAKALLTSVEKYLLRDDFNDITKKLDTMSGAIEKRFKAEEKRNYVKSSIALSGMLHDKTLKPEQVIALQQSGQLDPESAAIFYAASIKKVYDIPEGTSLTEPNYFLKLLSDASSDDPQVHKILKDAAEAYSENKMGDKQYLYFIQEAQNIFNEQDKALSGKSRYRVMLNSAIDGIKAFSNTAFKGANPVEEGYKMLLKFTDRFKPGLDPIKIAGEIKEEKILENIAKQEKESKPPELVIMYSPDGKKLGIPKANVKKALAKKFTYAPTK